MHVNSMSNNELLDSYIMYCCLNNYLRDSEKINQLINELKNRRLYRD